MKFVDNVSISGTRRRADGYLVADARVARTGIQLYAGWEVGKPDQPVVRVLRPESEVFNQDTMASFAHRPITDDHPDEAVTADNWKEYAVGNSADQVARDGTFLRVPLMVSDGETIKKVMSNKRELSAGYTAELDWTPGQTKDGEPYDAVQRNIRANHIAIVQNGRAGSEVRIGDDAFKWGTAPITTAQHDKEMSMNTRTITVDGLPIETTDAGAHAIAKLQKDLESSAAKLADAERQHAEAIKAKDAELAAKDEEIGTLKADKKKLEDAAPKPEDLDKMVADRAELVSVVKTIDAKIETAGKTDAELRKAAVVAKLGDAFVKDASEGEIAGMFKAIAKDAKPNDPYAATVKDGVAPNQEGASQVNDAYKQMVADMQSAHRPAVAN